VKIRFLQTVESLAPGYPFWPGQVIDVVSPPPELLPAINDGRAEVLRDSGSDDEVALASVAETTAVIGQPKGRRR
jgi:hypothetical protein